MNPRAVLHQYARQALPFFVWFAAVSIGAPHMARATGGYDEEAVPTLPYYLDRLPAKSPAEIFLETSPDAGAPAAPTEFRAALLSIADKVQVSSSGTPSLFLPTVDDLLARARRSPPSGPLCNLLNDVRDLFPPGSVAGPAVADYIRWRVEHADWFGLNLDPKKKPEPSADASDGNSSDHAQEIHTAQAAQLAARAKAKGPLRVHWLYLSGAVVYPDKGKEAFHQVVEEFPDHPRAESAWFMLARCKFHDYRAIDADASVDAASSRQTAREAFEDYLKRYPAGRFAADAKGWLGGLAFDEKNYLGALALYLDQADTPGHPEVLKSAGFMCERCLSHLSADANAKALGEIATRPRLAMSLIYLIVNTSESDNYNGALETPEQVSKWRRALLPRLAKEVAARASVYHDGAAAAGWQARYLAILAQAASGTGDQTRALALCDMAKGELDRSDDLAFIQLVALQRAHRLPEAIAAARAFAKHFPQSSLARGAALRLALALQDNHQAGLAVVELTRLASDPDKPPQPVKAEDENSPVEETHSFPGEDDPTIYPEADAELGAADSVLRHDISGAERDQLAQIIDALLCCAPLDELTPALDAARGFADGSFAIRWRAVLAQRWLGEEENFAEAKKYMTPAQWSVDASTLEKLAADAAARPADADALLRLADGWAAARGKLVFSPLETDKTRDDVFAGDAARAGLNRRENALALGMKADAVNHALEGRDEMTHASHWWLRAADAAPAGSPTRARALWSALKATPGIAFAAPYQLARANETKTQAAAHQLYDRLRRECPGSREAREFAVYYDIPAPPKKTDGSGDNPEQDKDPTTGNTWLFYGEPEYFYRDNGAFGQGDAAEENGGDSSADTGAILKRILALDGKQFTVSPKRMATEVAAIRKSFRALAFDRDDTALLNLLDDLDDLLKEDPAALTPDILKRYVDLRIECVHVEAWHQSWHDSLPPVPGVESGAVESEDLYEDGKDVAAAAKPLGSGAGVDDAVFNHIRAAYKVPGRAPIKDYLDFLALAVIANHRIVVSTGEPKPTNLPASVGDEAKDGPQNYASRDYPKLAQLTEGFLTDHPRSRKREAVRLLHARALYNASRPVQFNQFVVWPESGHFAGGEVVRTHRREPFEPRKIGAALNAYDQEFPGGRYAAEIRNLRALLAWRTQDWKIALDLTLGALDDKSAPDLQEQAALRLANIFSDGLTDETERTRLLAVIKAQPGAVKRLRAFLPKCDYPLRALRSWIDAQL